MTERIRQENPNNSFKMLFINYLKAEYPTKAEEFMLVFEEIGRKLLEISRGEGTVLTPDERIETERWLKEKGGNPFKGMFQELGEEAPEIVDAFLKSLPDLTPERKIELDEIREKIRRKFEEEEKGEEN